MDTSDSEAFESADENFDDHLESQNEIRMDDRSTSSVPSKLDDISSLLDNLNVKFNTNQHRDHSDPESEDEKTCIHKYSAEDDVHASTVRENTPVWKEETTVQDTVKGKFSAEDDVHASGWDEDDLIDCEVTETIIDQNIKHLDTVKNESSIEDEVPESGWDDDDVVGSEVAVKENTPTIKEGTIVQQDTVKSKLSAEDAVHESGWVEDDLTDCEVTETIADKNIIHLDAVKNKFSAENDVHESGWDDDDIIATEVSKKETILQPNKFSVVQDAGEPDASGWDNEVDWTPIENEDLVAAEATGWDDFDTWDTIEDVKTTPQPSEVTPADGGSSWSSWGVTSLLTSATEGVTTFTSQVSQGLTNVLESSIGVPSPEDLAKAQHLEREVVEDKSKELTPDTAALGGVFGFGNLLTGVTKLVETTSSKVVNTGLDTLETIGKKTMEVLQDGDPGLVKKRALLGLNPDKPCLSQVLREAKEKASAEDQQQQQQQSKNVVKKKVHFETLFDDYQGLVHLEALEMLSKQCDIKLCTIIDATQERGPKEFDELQETMVQIKELCELPDPEDDDDSEQSRHLDELKTKLGSAVEDLGIQISFQKLLTCWDTAEGEMHQLLEVHEVHRAGIDTLARITSIAVEQFHKCAELLLIKERRSTADEADCLVQLTTILTAFIGVVAAKYSERLDSLGCEGSDGSNDSGDVDLNGLITNVFFEATQSSSYIQDAFQLFIPILQIGAV